MDFPLVMSIFRAIDGRAQWIAYYNAINNPITALKSYEVFKQWKYPFVICNIDGSQRVAIINRIDSFVYILESHTPKQVWNLLADSYDNNLAEKLRVEE